MSASTGCRYNAEQEIARILRLHLNEACTGTVLGSLYVLGEKSIFGISRLSTLRAVHINLLLQSVHWFCAKACYLNCEQVLGYHASFALRTSSTVFLMAIHKVASCGFDLDLDVCKLQVTCKTVSWMSVSGCDEK